MQSLQSCFLTTLFSQPTAGAMAPIKGHVLGVKGLPLEREERLKKLMTSKAYGGTPAPRTKGEIVFFERLIGLGCWFRI